MAHSEAEQEASRVLLGERSVPGRDVGGLVHPDVEDARRHHHVCRRVHEPERVAQDIASGTTRDPQRAEAEGLELDRRLGGFARIAAAQHSAPDADSSEIHGAQTATHENHAFASSSRLRTRSAMS